MDKMNNDNIKGDADVEGKDLKETRAKDNDWQLLVAERRRICQGERPLMGVQKKRIKETRGQPWNYLHPNNKNGLGRLNLYMCDIHIHDAYAYRGREEGNYLSIILLKIYFKSEKVYQIW